MTNYLNINFNGKFHLFHILIYIFIRLSRLERQKAEKEKLFLERIKKSPQVEVLRPDFSFLSEEYIDI